VRAEATKQCDFYQNPTILSRLILNQKYASALRRLKNYPEEASVWVCSKRNPFKRNVQFASHRSLVSRPSMRRLNSKLDPQLLDYSIRQLPIHVACHSLFRCYESERVEVERLITHLAVIYPAGCEQPDHEGKLPLHEALWHNASPTTLSVLLMASPSTLHERDKYGRAPMELNRFRSGEDKEQVKHMLLRGVAYWESARDEAVMLTKQGNDNDILRNISMRLQKGASLGDVSYDLVEPVTWKKLELRAIYLEQLLSDMYEKNYELGEQVDMLSNEKMQLQDELDRLQNETSSREAGSEECVKDLCEELNFLRREISRLKKQLKKKNKSTSDEGEFDIDAIRYLEWSNATLQNELQEMTERNRENEVRLARLEIVATKLRKKVKDNEARQAQPESTGKEGDNKNGETVWEDFMDLLAMLSHQSPLATERFLAEKVLHLQDQLRAEARSCELSSAASYVDSTRLIEENEALQNRIRELSIEPARVGTTNNRRERQPTKNNPYRTDSLDEIFHQAAGLYSDELSESKELAFACFPEPPNEGDVQEQELSLEDIFPSNAFPSDPNMKAFDAVDDTGTWDSSHVKLLDAYEAGSDTKMKATTEPRRLKLVEISSQGTETVSQMPPQKVGPYSDTERSGSMTISEVSMDSLLRSKRSLRPPPSHKSASSSSLTEIPADVIVALRTASFSTNLSEGIEPILHETEVVLGRPIPDETKILIRERYRAEGGDLSKFLLAWLKEALGDSDDSMSLSIGDLSSIFAGADKIAEQMMSGGTDEQEISGATVDSEEVISGDTTDAEQVISGDTELSPMQASDNSSENPSSVLRRQWAAAFEETARCVSQRRIATSPLVSSRSKPSIGFNPDLVADDLNHIFADAAKMYALPLVASKPTARASQSQEVSSSQQPGAQRASVAKTNNLIDDLIRDYKSK